MSATTLTRHTSPTLARLRLGITSYFRSTDSFVFSFAFPILMFWIFATVFGHDNLATTTYYLAAMVASAALLSGMQTLATDIATERNDGTLKRLAGTPLSASSYLIGKFGVVLTSVCGQVMVLLVLAVTVFQVQLPIDANRWLIFAAVMVLSTATFACLGIALARIPQSAKAASGIVVPVVLVTQFLSGVYLPFSKLPSWMQQVSALFPVKWAAQGMRYVFTPDTSRALEVTGQREVGRVCLWLGLWLLAGLVLTRFTFRWIRRS